MRPTLRVVAKLTKLLRNFIVVALVISLSRVGLIAVPTTPVEKSRFTASHEERSQNLKMGILKSSRNLMDKTHWGK